MARNALVSSMWLAVVPSLAFGVHEVEGVVNDAHPVLTIGSPNWPESVYSGISLRILPNSPSELRFKEGEAAWAGTSHATIVDTELEQSIFLLDADSMLQLVPNPTPSFADLGLVLGDLIPSEFYGPFPNGGGPSHLDPFIEVTYRLVGSDQILSGHIESFAFIPEPSSAATMWLGIIGCLRFVGRRRRKSWASQMSWAQMSWAQMSWAQMSRTQ